MKHNVAIKFSQPVRYGIIQDVDFSHGLIMATDCIDDEWFESTWSGIIRERYPVSKIGKFVFDGYKWKLISINNK